MSGDDDRGLPRRGRRVRAVTTEEAKLWARVTASIAPMPRSARSLPRSEAAVEPVEASSAGPDSKCTTRRGRPRHDLPGESVGEPYRPVPPMRPRQLEHAQRPDPPRVQTPAPTGHPLQRHEVRRIARGHVDIDARLDLHGHFQADAHAKLRAFVLQAHHRGAKTLLVITGKGGPTAIAEEERSRRWDMEWQRRDRGVLRRNVPRWLAEPDLAGLIQSVTQAAQRHGGDGALYVVLRRKRG